jgi:hypothetical protein
VWKSRPPGSQNDASFPNLNEKDTVGVKLVKISWNETGCVFMDVCPGSTEMSPDMSLLNSPDDVLTDYKWVRLHSQTVFLVDGVR